jgi:hypothetical protein
MPEKAHVSSVDALKAFRTNLIVYVSKARPTVDEVNSEIVRTKDWLEREQRFRWENEARKRSKELERAQAALFSAKISNSRGAGMFEQMAVRKAKQAMDAAADKLRLIKHWEREYENRMQPLVKELDKLHTVLSHDLTLAISYLAQATQTLDDYAAVHATDGLSSPAASEPPPADGRPVPNKGGET